MLEIQEVNIQDSLIPFSKDSNNPSFKTTPSILNILDTAVSTTFREKERQIAAILLEHIGFRLQEARFLLNSH